MPAALPLVAGAFLAAGSIATAVGLTTAFVVAGLAISWAAVLTITGVALLAVAYLARKTPKPDSGGQQLKQKLDPQAPVPVLYGRSATGGFITWRGTWGSKNAFYGIVTVLSAGGPIAGIESYKAGDYPIGFGGSPAYSLATVNNVGGYSGSSKLYKGKLAQRWQNGAAPANTTPGGASGLPIPAGAMSGLAHVITRYEYSNDAFPQGLPSSLWTASGVKLYDPRQDSTYPGGSGAHRVDQPSTWTYSENPFLAALQWTLGRYENGRRVYGIGAKWAEVDVASFVTGANVADANGWKVGGVVTTDDDKYAVLASLLAAGGGVPVARGAQIACTVNAPKTSVLTLTKEDIVGEVETSSTTSWRDRQNTIIPKYREETQGWEIVAGEQISSPVYIEEDGGEQKTVEVEFPLVQQAAQAHQLATYELCNSREFLTFTVNAKLRLLAVRVGDAITVNVPQIAAKNIKCTITGREFNPSDMSVTLSLKSETDAKHAFALGQSQVAPPAPKLDGYDPSNPGAPAANAWAITATQITKDETTLPIIVVTGATDDPNTSTVIVEYRPTGSDTWLNYGEFPRTTTKVEISGLTDGTAYDVALSYRTVLGVVGERLVLNATAGAFKVSWSSTVTGPNKPQDGATKGAPPGTVVGDRPAEQVGPGIDKAQLEAEKATTALKNANGTGLYKVSDIVVDVEGLRATYGSTASAAENANKADVAKNAAEAARDIATQAKTTTETARNAAQAAQSAAEGVLGQTVTARDVTISARDAAQVAQTGAQSAKDAAASAEATARQKASDAAQSASSASGSASTASGQAIIATQKADAAGQSASNASASAQTANTKAGESGVSQYQAALSEQNAAGSRNAAASSASVAASTLTKTIEVIGNENFDNGLIGWSETGSMFIRAYSAGRSNVAETTPGQFVVMRGRIVSIVSSRQRFRLSIGYRGVSGKGFTNYLGVFFFKDDGSQIYGSDGTGNYPLGAGFSVSPEVDNGWQDRNVYIGKGDVPGSAYGGTTVIPDGAVSFQPVAYLNYVALSDDAVAQVDYFRVEDATTEFYASKSATAAAQSSANAAASENNAGQAATAAQHSATNAATSAGKASASASQASTSATSAEGSKNAAASSASLSAGSATDSANKAQAAANSAGAAKTSETNAGQSASSASASANTANTKAGEASASATQAATSESNAAGSKNAASASANLAAGSATDAANKAQAAANSATAAKTSETNAGQSAVSATGSANTATTKAGEASSSATSAATSASNAEGAKNAAYASQTQAAASADTAQQKAGAAASSASSAATSADSAGQSAGAAQSSATNAATSAGSASTSASQASKSAANAEGSRIAAASSASVAATSADAASVSAKATLPSNFADAKNWANYGGWGGSVTFENGKANLKNGGSFYSTFTMPVAAGETYRVTTRHRTVNQGGGVTYIGLIELAPSGAPGSIVWQIGGRPTAQVNEWEVSVFEFTGEYVVGQYGPIKSIGVVFLSGYPNVSDAEVSLLQMENVTSEKKAALAASAAATNASNAAISAGIAGQNASAAQGSATNAATSAGNASTSASQASSSASIAQGAANSAASSAAVAASSYNKSVAAIGNDNFDSGTDGWFDASQMVPVVSSYGRSNVIRSNAGAYIAPLHGRKIPITSVSQIFRLRISLRCAVAQSVYYVGAIYYDGNDAIVAATDGTGNYPLGASFTLDSTVHGWLDRETIIGKTVTGYTYGGNQNIPANAAYFRPCIYLNYSQIGNSVTEVDYYTVEDVTAFMQAANSASAAAGSASNAATSASNAGQSASAANTSKVQAEAANGAAQSAASNAQSSAATASSKASEASSFANLSASYSAATEGNRRNLIKTEWWRAGVTIPWDKNGGQEDRIYSLPDGLNNDGNWSNIKGPDGSAGDVWLSRANSVGHEGGGWNNGPIVPLDPDKTYRFVVPIAALGFQGGVSYWGTGNVCELNSTTPNPNPYFATYGNLPLNRWHLFVGYIFPRNSTGKTHDGAGVWDMVTGVKLGAGSNYCFTPGGYQPIHRAYQYYATSGRYQAFGRPLVECVDGSETPFALLLGAKLDSTNNAAAIRDESSARATALSSMSARQSSVEVQVGGMASRVQSAEGAIAAIDGKTQAYFEKKASVPGADAFISAVAKNDNGVATSNVAIGGTSIALYNIENNSAKRAMFLGGGQAVFDGSITANGGILVGTGKLKVQVQAQDYAVSHDQYVSFGYDLGRAPTITFGPCPVSLATDEVYAPYAAEVSATGFRAKLVINAAPQNSAQSTGAFANQGNNIYQVARGGRAQAANGNYTVTVNLYATAYAYRDDLYE